ncbi:UDP-glucuronosyltransferase [Sergentomyia squamirostris]
MVFRVIFLFLFTFPLFQCENILVLETVASPSHHIWIRTLTTALAEKGHNVTSLSTDIEDVTPKNLHYLHLDKVYDVFYDPTDQDFKEEFDFLSMGKVNIFMQLLDFFDFPLLTVKGCFRSTGFHQLMAYPDDFKFDLVIYDFMVGGVMLPFVQKFNYPPVVALTAFYSASYAAPIVGGTLHPAFVPSIVSSDKPGGFLSRLENFLVTHLDYFLREFYVNPKLNKILKEKFPWAKDVRELNQLAKIVLLNKHAGMDVIEPAFSNIIPVGGMQIQRTKTLPKDLQDILDQAKNGVILFSLGTNVKSSMLGDARITEILETFRALPELTFLWKFESETLPVTVPSNVIIRSFVPQNDILAHPNVKLFITHGGLLSTQESVWHGVPMLGLPVFADQFQNVKLSIEGGVAEEGDLINIERKSFKTLIQKLLNEPKYRENARIRSEAFRDQRETPLERAVWWTEFVLRHPNMTFMRSPSLDQNFAVRHSWDVLAFFFTTILISMIVSLKLSCCVLRSCLKKNKSKKSKRE